MSGAANDSSVVPITAAHTVRQGASRHADTSLSSPETPAKGKKSTPTAGKVRADALRMLGCVRTATVRQMAKVITAEDADGRSYVRRAMKELAELGLAETNGKDGGTRSGTSPWRGRGLWPTATSCLSAGTLGARSTPEGGRCFHCEGPGSARPLWERSRTAGYDVA